MIEYNCGKCSQHFIRKDHYLKHLTKKKSCNKNANSVNYICSKCNFSTKNKSYFIRHLKSNTSCNKIKSSGVKNNIYSKDNNSKTNDGLLSTKSPINYDDIVNKLSSDIISNINARKTVEKSSDKTQENNADKIGEYDEKLYHKSIPLNLVSFHGIEITLNDIIACIPDDNGNHNFENVHFIDEIYRILSNTNSVYCADFSRNRYRFLNDEYQYEIINGELIKKIALEIGPNIINKIAEEKVLYVVKNTQKPEYDKMNILLYYLRFTTELYKKIANKIMARLEKTSDVKKEIIEIAGKIRNSSNLGIINSKNIMNYVGNIKEYRPSREYWAKIKQIQSDEISRIIFENGDVQIPIKLQYLRETLNENLFAK